MHVQSSGGFSPVAISLKYFINEILMTEKMVEDIYVHYCNLHLSGDKCESMLMILN